MMTTDTQRSLAENAHSYPRTAQQSDKGFFINSLLSSAVAAGPSVVKYGALLACGGLLHGLLMQPDQGMLSAHERGRRLMKNDGLLLAKDTLNAQMIKELAEDNEKLRSVTVALNDSKVKTEAKNRELESTVRSLQDELHAIQTPEADMRWERLVSVLLEHRRNRMIIQTFCKRLRQLHTQMEMERARHNKEEEEAWAKEEEYRREHEASYDDYEEQLHQLHADQAQFSALKSRLKAALSSIQAKLGTAAKGVSHKRASAGRGGKGEPNLSPLVNEIRQIQEMLFASSP